METTSTTTNNTHTLDEQVDHIEQNLSRNSKLTPIETQSLPSNEDATERNSTPRDSDDDTEEDLDDSEYDSSDYETGSETGSETSYVDATSNPMYMIMSSFLENADLENRVNITEAVLQLKSSVDRIADALEKMASRPKRRGEKK